MIFFRGATSWEFAIGPFWMTWPFWNFMRVGCWPRAGYEKEWRE